MESKTGNGVQLLYHKAVSVSVSIFLRILILEHKIYLGRKKIFFFIWK